VSANEGFVVVGPSQVDLSLHLSEIQLSKIRNLGLAAGEWMDLPAFEQVVKIAGLLLDEELSADDLFQQIEQKGALQLEAGSSTLGMLCAMPVQLRDTSVYASVLAGVEGEVNPFSSYFDQVLQAEGLRHQYVVRHGTPPIGFVMESDSAPDRILASHAGVAVMAPPRPEIRTLGVILEAYELRSKAVADWFGNYLGSGSSGYLSLGSVGVLKGVAGRRLRSLIRSGGITAVAGSQKEFACLFPNLAHSFVTPDGFCEHPVRHAVAYSMITFGAEGMAVHWKNTYLRTLSKFVPPERIVNTSGAGDAAAGRFFAGIAMREDPTAVLSHAATLAARVLEVRSSRLSPRSARGRD
jgi:hypothetical protein